MRAPGTTLRRAVFGLSAAWLVLVSSAQAQLTFSEVADAVGLVGDDTVEGFGTGAAAVDYDDDGWVDLFLPTAAGRAHQLFRNLGNGHFEEIAADIGLDSTDPAKVALWLDYDGDGDLDLFLAGDCFRADCESAGSHQRLFRREGDGTFLERTQQAGLLDLGRTRDEHRAGAAAGDLDGDGYLDLVTGFWMGTLHVYLNQRDGSFLDVSVASGIGSTTIGHWQPVLVDFDADGLLDIYSSVDLSENLLFLNQGTSAGMPLFSEEAAAAGCDNAMNDMGVALGDFDEDGDPDLYVSNIYRLDLHNVLLRNDTAPGAAACAEISQQAGVQDGGWGWGTTFLDVDNDGDLDLAETNGWHLSGWAHPPRLFVNQGGVSPTFVDQAASAGLTDTSWGSALLGFDYDRDGDLDLVQTLGAGHRNGARSTVANSLMLFRSALAGSEEAGHHLVVRPRMAGTNPQAIGARVTLEVGERTMTRWITAGGSFLGQEPAEAYFGLGSASVADRVTVRWPGGEATVLEEVAADQVYTVTHPGIFADGFESGDTYLWSSLVP